MVASVCETGYSNEKRVETIFLFVLDRMEGNGNNNGKNGTRKSSRRKMPPKKHNEPFYDPRGALQGLSRSMKVALPGARNHNNDPNLPPVRINTGSVKPFSLGPSRLGPVEHVLKRVADLKPSLKKPSALKQAPKAGKKGKTLKLQKSVFGNATAASRRQAQANKKLARTMKKTPTLYKPNTTRGPLQVSELNTMFNSNSNKSKHPNNNNL
jgi:hypothetical protein